MRKKDDILGESRTCRVTLNVTPTMAKKLRALVRITGFSVTVLGLPSPSIKKSAYMTRGSEFLRSDWHTPTQAG